MDKHEIQSLLTVLGADSRRRTVPIMSKALSGGIGGAQPLAPGASPTADDIASSRRKDATPGRLLV